MKIKDYYRNVTWEEPTKLIGRYAKILNMVVNEVGSSRKVIDVGAGSGAISNELRKNGNSVFCMEINKDAIRMLKEKRLSVIEQDIEDKWKVKSNSFDTVVMTEVLEHCFATSHILNESHRVLKKGGRVVITTPNITSLGHRLQILLGREPSYYSHTGFEHIRIFTPLSMRILMEKSGFNKIKIKTILGFSVRNFGEIIYAVGEKK